MDQKENSANIRGVFHPIWILFSITIPQSIFIIIFSNIYLTINAEFDKKQDVLWIVFGLIFTGLVICYTMYSIFMWIKKKEVNKFIPVIVLVSYMGFIYSISFFIGKILGGLPAWMISIDNLILLFATFVVPAFFYGIIVLERLADRYLKIKKAWLNLIIAVVIPLFWFLFFFFIRHVRINFHITNFFVFKHLLVILVIISTLGFYFFILKGIIGIYKNNSGKLNRIIPVVTVLFALIFPVTGILLNEMYFPFSLLKNFDFLKYIDNFHPLFGDFSNPVFLIIVITTGLVLLIPGIKNKYIRIPVFILRSILFAFSLYFFVIFMPFYPFFVFANILFGVGLLLISPAVLFVIHLNKLKQDISYLKQFFNKKIISGICLLLMLILPVFVITGLFIEKANLYKALKYVYYPDYNTRQKIRINNKLLEKTLHRIENSKRTFFENDTKIPLITPLHKKIVMNNLTLSNKKINKLAAIFIDNNIAFNNSLSWNQWNSTDNKSVSITDLKANTDFNKQDKLYSTWIDLNIENNSKFISEFVTYLELPEGVWIDDYYLYVNNIKKKGLLAEKKSVLWAYEQIKNENRDPGIIYYVHNNITALKVFPLLEKEKRKTGFKLVHIEPLKISYKNNKIQIKTENTLKEPVYSKNKNAVYIPYKTKEKLNTTILKPYYHFIIDCSENAENQKDNFIQRINNIIKDKNIDKSQIKIIFTDYSTETIDNTGEYRELLKKHKNTGGFFLERALSEIYYNNYISEELYYPVPVIITNRDIKSELDNITAIKNLISMDMNPPFFYQVNKEGDLLQYNIYNDSIDENFLPVEDISVYKFNYNNKTVYLPINNKPSFKFIDADKPGEFNFEEENSINNLIALNGLQKWDFLHPDLSEKTWEKIYYNSIKMNVLTTKTSFVVFENEAQENMMLKKQNQIINSKKFLDAGKEMDEEMPEPPLLVIGILLLILFAIVWIIKKRRVFYS